MRVAITVLAFVGAIAIVFVILGVVIRLLGFLLWVGLIVLLVAVIVFLVRSLMRRRA
jgi:hypothetical protein